MTYAAIDFDGFLYAAACAVEEHYCEVQGNRFSGKYGLKEARALCDEQRPMIPHNYIESKKDVGPVSHAIHSLKSMKNRLIGDLKDEGVTVWDFFMGNEDSSKNFRFSYNPEYKANRPPKPTHLKALREYAAKNFDCIQCDPSLETDDEVACAAMEYDGIIVSVDKDFEQVPVRRWNWRERDWCVRTGPPEYSLCKQLLTGDATDNIKTGLYQYGPDGISQVHEMRLHKTSFEKIAKEMGCGTTAVKQMLDLNVTDKYGNVGPAFADKLLAKFDNPHHGVMHQYHKIFGIHAELALKTVGHQIYLLRDLDDSFDKYYEENFNA